MTTKQSGREPVSREAQVKKILAEIDEVKRECEKKGMKCVVLDEEQLRRKLARAKSPMIVGQSWSDGGPGGSVTYSVYVKNPDPSAWGWVFAYVFVGPANIVTSPGEALAVADARFPRLTQPAFPGQSIAANETARLDFAIQIPTGIQAGNYQGNAFVYQADWHDVGDYLDRGTFVFKVT